MLFNEEVPESQFEIDPTYLPENRKFLASILGFKPTGERNNWGNTMRFLPVPLLPPGSGAIASNIAARQLGTKSSDYGQHVKENLSGDISGTLVGQGAGAIAGGILSGNPAMVGSGAESVLSNVPNAFNFKDVNLNGDWETKYYRKGGIIHYDEGGKIIMVNGKKPWWDGGEDIAMLDKKTGAHVGDVSYGERIMDKGANKKMKELADKKSFYKLGKYIADEMETQNDTDNETEEFKEGGELTADKAKLILKDGTIRGKKITPKQKRFFGFIAGGGHPSQYKSGGTIEVKKYDTGGDILSPDGDVQDILNNQTDQNLFNLVKQNNWGIPAGKTSDAPSTPFNWDELGGPEQLFNIGQLITGITGANDKLPSYHKPDEWNRFLLDQRARSLYGMTNAERADLQRMNDRALTTGLNNAREISGGNSSFAVGEASKFAGDYMDRALKLAVANDKIKQDATARYGNTLMHDIAYDKDAFDQKYQEALMKKSAAAKLAHTGLQNTIDQADYEKNYGKNSVNQQYLQAQLDLVKKLTGMDYSQFVRGLIPDVATPTTDSFGAPIATEFTGGSNQDWWNSVNQ